MPLLLMSGASSNALNISPSNIANFDVNKLTPQNVTVTGGLPPYTATASNGEVCSVTQGTSPNRISDADTLTGWTVNGAVTKGSGGPFGAKDLEYVGTGSASTGSDYALSGNQTVVSGATYVLSIYVDNRYVSAGSVALQVLASDGVTVLFTQNVPTNTSGRWNYSFTPATTTVRFKPTIATATVTSGKTVLFSQPMLTVTGVDYTTYLSPTSVFTVTPIYRGSATITYSDSTP